MKEMTLYVTAYCPYCHAAIDYVKKQNYPHRVIAVDKQPELRKKISAANQGWSTVPMIFVGDEFIGGYTDMMQLVEGGQLEKKLHAN